ncbi:acetyl-CoA acetyltransferase [Myxococcus stipitatus DSM 14675]|uniref:acetyl-CoA C-acetyltransferase n=1 Tax=Myxococcus stipitatus (strain DSM 14675 / JCM 12634 / Mx s8) TaxID=1278073 RepID=L7U947_MYXSD|nr:acetyl-CoA C-acetyltransferase [Myxococcus stipitatus]AGC45426.1 acetyl-CoA acetyltransferase [Myxococcus stipitatus DSM 14675]
MARDVVIVGAARTPIGAFQGALSKLTAPQLGAVAIKAALERAGVKPEAVQEVIMGNVLQAGVGQAPARQATLFAGLPEGVPATTLNKVCGSGLKAVIAGAQAIALGEADVVVVGGMESMSNAPYISHTMRGGARMGNVEFKDAMIHDGLWDVYGNVHMGNCAEECATSQNISRAQQDEFALESTRRAIQSQKEGLFAAEIVPVVIPGKKPGEETTVSEDEGPRNAKPDKIPGLKPVFKKDGTVTAANASSINDGAAALVLMSEERAKAEGKTILGRITGYAQAARKPVEFTIAPADAINTLLTKKGVKAADVDLWEINEAFAVVAIANNRLLGLDPAKVNVRGGGVVLGHPIGASGARVLVTLLQTMKDQGKKRGVASLCIGGGEGIALMVER